MGISNIVLAAVTLSISPDGTNDMTSAVMGALDKARLAGGGKIVFAPGDYHFRSPVRKNWYVSNHRNPVPRDVFVPVTNLTDTVLESERAEFVFHGGGLGFALVDTRNVTVKGISFDYSRPYNTEWKLVGFDGGRPVLETDPSRFPFSTESGMLANAGECWPGQERIIVVFDRDTREPISVAGFSGKCRRLSDRRVMLDVQMEKKESVRPMLPGSTVVTRCAYRPNPAVFLYRAHSTLFEDVIVRASGGMGIIAQRCRDVTIRGSRPAEARTAGAMARAGSGRVTSMQADATHFSNCGGSVKVVDCWFEGMVDDAINVHSTCLKIEAVPGEDRLRCRYMHYESFGFETFLPGERLRFIKVKPFEPGAEAVVKAVKWIDPMLLELTLDRPVPPGYGAGDAVENADWQPDVVFSRNVVTRSRPRATLFTTPGKVLCESNRFEKVAGQPIHLSADAADWFESGACRDVVIRGNVFKDCFTHYKGGKRGIITVNPNIKDIASQRERYHRNILVEGNSFDCGDVPLVWAWSVSNFVWRANTVRRPSGAKSEEFIFEHSDAVHIDEETTAVVPSERGRGSALSAGGWKWIDAATLELQGKPFADADGFYSRLPLYAKKDVVSGTWAMSRCTAGMSFVFRTTSPKLRVRWSLTSGGLALTHMPATGVSGVDLYVRTEKDVWRFVKAGFPRKREGNEFEVSVVPGRLYRLYLPLYNGIKSAAFGIVPGTELVSAPLPGPRERKPVVFYGGSVVQGACSSRPGNAWVNIAGRMLDSPTVCMGFNGQGRMIPFEADLLAKIDASAYCFLTLGNMRGDTYRGEAERFLRRLAELRPGVPIVFGSFHYPLVDDRGKHAFAAELKAKLRKEDPEKWAAFDTVGLGEMCSDDCDGTVDGGHPNDYGAYRMAEAFSAAVRRNSRDAGK